MPADASVILDAVKAALTVAYPTVTVYESKRASTDRKNPAAGYQASFKLPCFVVSCGDAEGIDQRPSFGVMTVNYPVLVEYVWSAQEKIANAPNEGAPAGVEDPAIRDIRAAVRQALYRPYLVPGLTRDVTMRTRRPYDVPSATGDGRVIASGQEFNYLATNDRPPTS